MRYCLDTGAEINALSNEVPKKVFQHFRLTSRNALTGTSNQKVEVFGGELDELTIGTYTFVNSQTILTGLAGLQSVYSTELDGILGYNFLAEGRVVKAANKHVMMSALAYNLKKLLKFDRPKLKTIAKALQKETIKTGELLHFSKGLYEKQIRQF